MRVRTLAAGVAASALALLAPATAAASPSVQYGIQDDAWLAYGPGSLDQRLDRLDGLGVSIVRYTLHWNEIARRRPASPASASDPAYDWGVADAVLGGLRARGIAAVVTIYGTPAWANGGRTPNWAPSSPSAIAGFARAAARRYPWVQRWLVWNEPNQRRSLLPTSPRVYVQRLLNPAYAALHATRLGILVGGGVTAPRGNVGGVAPVDWITGMRAAHARLDAYAHNPYPLDPRRETPWSGGCSTCKTLTMATLDRLVTEVNRNFGPKRIWLTEYGYQTNPPDKLLGVSKSLQARYLADASLRAYETPRVDMLIQFLVQDEPILGRWQSGLLSVDGTPKPSFYAFSLPLSQVSRRGDQTVLWGQVRPRFGTQVYRLEEQRAGRWILAGATAHTSAGGFFQRVVQAGAGARFRIWSPRDRAYSPVLVVR